MSFPKIRFGTRLAPDRIRFHFDGREYTAQQGDTAASALLSHGVRLLGRSVKYRRPRGILSAGPEEPNALLTEGTPPRVIPNVPAPQLVLRDGLVLRSQNRWPSLRFDVGSILQVGGALFGAGFYYKTFLWPSWRTYEPLIRNLAGLGEAPRVANLPRPAIEHLSCEVLVGGAGPAGLAAALAASRMGARVVVCEREPQCGGELDFEEGTVEGVPAKDWLATTQAELARRGARILRDTTIIGGSAGLVIAHAEPGGLPGQNALYRIRPQRFVIALGAIERPIAFINNDRPGVMLLGAAERYLARYGVAAGQNVVLFGNHDRLYSAAARLVRSGIRVRAVIDTREESFPTAGAGALSKIRTEFMQLGIECLSGHAVLRAEGAIAVRAVRIAPLDAPQRQRRIECDAVFVSGGWSPCVHAGLHEGGAPSMIEGTGTWVADTQPDWRMNAGAANGNFDLPTVLTDGFATGERAAREAGRRQSAGVSPRAIGDAPPRLVPFWRSPASLNNEKRQFVDCQNDVTVADLRQALEEGFLDIEHIKRYTTLGIGTEQGRTGSALGAAIVAELKGVKLSEVGISRTRPPYHPITLNTLVAHRLGANLRALRRTPLHQWHEGHGALMESADLWMRPRYYRSNGASVFDAGVTEATRVRAHGGIFDGSTLGKIEVAGKDAPEFLDRLYLTKASTIKVGRSRYMVNLREDGMVLDDGIVLRLADDKYLATTSSGHAGHMLAHFEHYRDTEHSGRAIALTDVTEAWGVIVVAGPRCRELLQSVLGNELQSEVCRLTHMGFCLGECRGTELRVLRASFSGELAYELHCRPAIAPVLWQALADAGLQPYGLEALDILRVEKGYLTEAELNGQTTPNDLGMEKLVEQNNRCVGRALLDRPAFREASRPRLVGLKAADNKSMILGGAQITSAELPTSSLGYVSSSVYSPALGEWIGLGFIARASVLDGTQLVARDPLHGADIPIRVGPLVHFDPTGERMKS